MKIFLSVTFAILVVIALYYFYINGYVVTQVKKAAMYVESKRGRCATFSSCTGFTRRVIRFQESETYHFSFAAELTQGDVSAELLDSKKNMIMRFDSDTQSGDVLVEKKTNYYLVFRFKKATGKYVLDIQSKA